MYFSNIILGSDSSLYVNWKKKFSIYVRFKYVIDVVEVGILINIPKFELIVVLVEGFYFFVAGTSIIQLYLSGHTRIVSFLFK